MLIKPKDPVGLLKDSQQFSKNLIFVDYYEEKVDSNLA